jgi:hypothetical protein
MPFLLIEWFIFEYQRLAIFDRGFNTEMQQVTKKIELFWSLAITIALLQGIAAWIKAPRQATGILDPRTNCASKHTNTKAKNGCLDIVPDQPWRQIVCTKAPRELLVCWRVGPDTETALALCPNSGYRIT